MKQAYLIIAFILIKESVNFDCRRNKNDLCLNNTICSDSGLCACPQFYYGMNCDKLLPESKTLSFHNEGISLGSYLGIITGLVVSLPILLIGGLLIIFFTLKDRDY